MQKSLLFIPGPVSVAEPVLAAMARPLVNHRGPEFSALLGSIAERLKPIFGTKNDVLLLGASGTGGLEAGVTNLFGPGDTVLACPIGTFGDRIISIAKTWGCTVETLETAWGAGVDPDALAARLRADRDKKIAGILFTHNETSTGVQLDMAAMARAVGDHPALTVVDSVSGLGASEFKMDEWKLDLVITASQKALAVPPGIAMVAVSPRAWEKMAQNKAPRFYFDLRKAKDMASHGETPWTPPVSIAYALDVALDLYHAEGAPNVWARHARYTAAVHAAVEALGMRIFSEAGVHSVTVTAIEVPAGVNQKSVLKKLREEHGVVLAGGQGKIADQVWRWGTMGAISEVDVVGAIGAFERVLREEGYAFELGAGVRAALEVFAGATRGGSRTAGIPAAV
jgi:aspartate aminotransferase-like enzyme